MKAMLAAVSLAGAAWLLSPPGGRGTRRLAQASAGGLATGDPGRPFTAIADRFERRRLRQRHDAEAVILCAALAAELRAGQPPAAALAAAAGELALLGPRLRGAVRAVGRGAFLGEELAQAGAAESCARLSAVAAICAAGEASGSPVADVLDRVARGMASDDEAAAELTALAAGPRATAVVLAGLPGVAVALATALGLAPLRILFHTALGIALWTSAALLEVLGLCWVRRITAAALNG